MSGIPLFIIEEHHEAFLVWNYAGLRELIPATGNTLLHVDHHADMGPPRFRTPIKDLPAEPAELARFTYDELYIADFIPAALYQGWFKELCWLQHDPPATSRTLYVHSYNGAGRTLLTTTRPDDAHSRDPDRQRVPYEVMTVDDRFPEKDGVVLDIDLDYFSCDRLYQSGDLGQQRVEITREEYERFLAHRYHFLRVSVAGVTPHAEGGRYYLLINASCESVPSPFKVTEDRIRERVERLGGFLRDNHVRPRLIDICRSRHSGFTPADQWAFIEEQLLAVLRDLYACETTHIDDLLGEAWGAAAPPLA